MTRFPILRSGMCLLTCLIGTTGASAPTDADGLARFRDIYKELVETNTTLSVGDCTLAARRMGARLKAAGDSDPDDRACGCH